MIPTSLWALPSTIRWWVPARPADGTPCADDADTARLIQRWMSRHGSLGAVEALWVATPPRVRAPKLSRGRGLARRTDGRPGDVVCRLGVRSAGATPTAAGRSVDTFEDAIGTLFEVGSHDGRRSADPELPACVHPVELLMAPPGGPAPIEAFAEVPEHLARVAIRSGPVALHVRVTPLLDSARAIPQIDEAHRQAVARDRHRFRSPRAATALRSQVLRDLRDQILLHMAIRTVAPLDGATRLALESAFSNALGAPVEIRDPDAVSTPVPVEGDVASMLLGAALHAFSGARRPSAARLRHIEDGGMPAPNGRRRRPMVLRGSEDEEG
jgi:hypothetical protein